MGGRVLLLLVVVVAALLGGASAMDDRHWGLPDHVAQRLDEICARWSYRWYDQGLDRELQEMIQGTPCEKGVCYGYAVTYLAKFFQQHRSFNKNEKYLHDLASLETIWGEQSGDSHKMKSLVVQAQSYKAVGNEDIAEQGKRLGHEGDANLELVPEIPDEKLAAGDLSLVAARADFELGRLVDHGYGFLLGRVGVETMFRKSRGNGPEAYRHAWAFIAQPPFFSEGEQTASLAVFDANHGELVCASATPTQSDGATLVELMRLITGDDVTDYGGCEVSAAFLVQKEKVAHFSQEVDFPGYFYSGEGLPNPPVRAWLQPEHSPAAAAWGPSFPSSAAAATAAVNVGVEEDGGDDERIGLACQIPDVLGRPGSEAAAAIQTACPTLAVEVVEEGGAVTMDFNEDRVRLYLDGEGRVASQPERG
eukprot:gnl/Hemi2/13842_TR4710_c0_g1_i1.p1 gnl/Hemi2/13842_TR4710_c0_g1~~gnl/Hemi2/13842_TR4710_c0_g1_i1.p1  ORF type:complete len:421 (+),score=130.93 gnl/Hemi2/13842_TR4710_c0_g1_i1:56-1318(+)